MEPAQHQGSSSQSLQNGSRVRFAEEEPGPEAVHSQSALRAREKAAVETAPEVYWADDRSDGANLSQYTFYREGTPTPPEYEEGHQKELGYGARAGAGAGTGAVAEGSTSRMGDYPPNQHGHGGEDWSSTSSSEVVCGIRKTAFWTIIGLLILFFIALALGVGLGVGLHTTRTEAPPPIPSSTSSSSPAISDSAGDSSTPTASGSSGSSGTIPSTCPAANNTLYTTTTNVSKKTFLRLCGVDYSGIGGAKDLKSVNTKSMDECMDVCASVSDCTGCGWGYIYGDSGNVHRCWLKTKLETGHNATKDWIFAILQTK